MLKPNCDIRKFGWRTNCYQVSKEEEKLITDQRLNYSWKLKVKNSGYKKKREKHRKDCESALYAKKGFIQSLLLLSALSALSILSELSVNFTL